MDEEVPGKAYARAYIDGMTFGIWVGMGFGVAFSMIAWAMYHALWGGSSRVDQKSCCLRRLR
jgi:hypothetical protein